MFFVGFVAGFFAGIYTCHRLCHNDVHLDTTSLNKKLIKKSDEVPVMDPPIM